MKRAIVLLATLWPAALAAQQAVDSRWLPWLGCWEAADGAASSVDSILVCVRPAGEGRGVEIATIADGAVQSTRALIADGRRHDLTIEDCTGTQTASFSGDGRRVYLRSTISCPDAPRRTASAIMAMASPNEWLDAQALGAEGRGVPRVLWYQPAPEARWPEEFVLTGPRADAVREARYTAATRLTLLDVEEAADEVDPEALAAFVIEQNQTFDLTAGQLAALDDAGVPDEVIDAVVATSYPDRFVVDRQAVNVAQRASEADTLEGLRPAYGDPFGWGAWGYGRCWSWGAAMWSPFCGGYWAYGYGGFGSYWYDPYYGSGYWGYPVIVVRDGSVAPSAGGRAVRGRGYTRGGETSGSAGGSTARPRGRSSAPSSGSSPSPSTSSRAPSSSGSSGRASPSGYTRGGSSSGSSSRPAGSARPRRP